jgi:hypothetical protein
MASDAEPAEVARPPRGRRTTSYWEPMYDAQDRAPYPNQAWDFEHNKGPAHVTLTSDDLDIAINAGLRTRFEGIRFQRCDFFGEFDKSPRELVFIGCDFEHCDFGLSTWRRAKFTRCEFSKTSFSQSKWDDCDFRNCTWKDIGLSGNATDLSATTITNPRAFIAAAYTNLDPSVLGPRNITARYQKMRLEATKATVARALVRMFEFYGDEGAYYDAIRASSNQSLDARISEEVHTFLKGSFVQKATSALSIPFNLLEKIILNGAGFINGWGRSIARPAMIGTILISFFALVYSIRYDKPLLTGFIQSIEVTLLIGYTAWANSSLPIGDHLILAANMILGLFWYIVFVPTLVNRLSRLR